eukprot:5691016-Amphidinium_carterae.1
MGVCACRTVMLDSPEERRAPVANPLWLFITSYATSSPQIATTLSRMCIVFVFVLAGSQNVSC